MRVNYDVLHRGRSVTFGAASGFTAVVLGNDCAPAVWVKENLGGIEPQATSGIKRARHSVGIDLARLHLWYKNMPVVIGAVNGGIETDHTCRVTVILLVEKQEFYTRGMARENAKVDASVGWCRSDRGALASRHFPIHVGYIQVDLMYGKSTRAPCQVESKSVR
jgi:hypothetical protein